MGAAMYLIKRLQKKNEVSIKEAYKGSSKFRDQRSSLLIFERSKYSSVILYLCHLTVPNLSRSPKWPIQAILGHTRAKISRTLVSLLKKIVPKWWLLEPFSVMTDKFGAMGATGSVEAVLPHMGGHGQRFAHRQGISPTFAFSLSRFIFSFQHIYMEWIIWFWEDMRGHEQRFAHHQVLSLFSPPFCLSLSRFSFYFFTKTKTQEVLRTMCWCIQAGPNLLFFNIVQMALDPPTSFLTIMLHTFWKDC